MNPRARARRLFIVVGIGVAMWQTIVPRIQQSDGYRARQQLFQTRRIDPSAMFYTELECLETALDNTRYRFRKRGPPYARRPDVEQRSLPQEAP